MANQPCADRTRASQPRERLPRAAGSNEPPVALGRLASMLRFRMKRLSKRLSDEFAAASSSYNLNSGELSALAIIEATPGVAQVALSRELNMDKAIVVAVVDTLERRGWAERRRNPDDRRRHSLYITPRGSEALETMCELVQAAEGPLLAGLTRRDRDLLFAALDHIDNALPR